MVNGLRYWNGTAFVNLVRNTFTATLASGSWSGASAPFTQAVSITDLLATDTPHVTVDYSATLATALLEKEAWALVSYAESSAGTITFTCLEEKPTVALNIVIEVTR